MHDEYHVLKIYIKIVLFATIIMGMMTIFNYQMYGEGIGLNLHLDIITLFLVMCIQCITIMLSIPIFKWTKNIRIAFGNSCEKIYFCINKKRAHKFIFLILIFQMFFSIHTGNGVVGNTSSVSGTWVSYLFNIFKVTAFMPIYYVAARQKEKKTLYWINIILWVLYELMCGWTSIIPEVAFIELFLMVKSKIYNRLVQLCYKLSGVAAIVACCIGGFIYKYAWVFKNSIRYGYEVQSITYIEGLRKLISRFTSYPISVVSIQNHDQIVQLYRAQGVSCVDVMAIFRSLLPSFLMPNKGFRTLNNIVLQSMYLDLANTTSSDYCLWLFWRNLFFSSIRDFLIYIIITVVFLVISKKIIYAFDDGSGNVDILYFFLIFQFLSGYSIENLFGYGYIGLLYFIPIMIFLGIIKLKKSYKSRL